MRRKTLSLTLLCALGVLLCAGRSFAQGDAPKDAPGWVIILAVDYTGPGGKLYDAVQEDAIKACEVAVAKWGVPPDHIALLAEGPKITGFLNELKKPDSKRLELPAQASAFPKTDKMIDSSQNNEVQAYGIMFVSQAVEKGSAQTPYVLPPTAQNFILTRNLLSRLATPDQFLTMVVSAHAQTDAGSVSENTPLQVIAKPENGTLGKNDILDASQFDLADSKAGNRLLLIDASNNGEIIKRVTTRIAPFMGGGGRFDARDTFNLLETLAKEGKGVPVVMSAARSMRGATSLPENRGSAFLQAFFDNLKELPDAENTSLKELFRKAQNRAAMNASRQNASQEPQVYFKADAAEISAVLGKSKKVIVAPNNENSGQPGTTPPKIPTEAHVEEGVHPITNEPVGNVFLGNSKSAIASIPGKNKSKEDALRRAGIVKNRLVELITLLNQTPGKAKDIRAGREKDVWVVYAPIKDKWVITADAKFATMVNLKPKDLADQIASAIRKAFIGHTERISAFMGGEEPDTGMGLYHTGLDLEKKNNLAGAEEYYKKAIDRAPDLMIAYFSLIRLQIKQGKITDAKLTLRQLQNVAADSNNLEPDQKHEIEQAIATLNKQLGN